MINFGVGRNIAVPKYLADGSAIANPTPVILGTLQDISVDMGVEVKKLYGGKRYPIAVGQGKGEIGIKAKYAEFSGAIYGSLFAGKTPTAGIKGADMDVPGAIPGVSTYTITVVPSNSGTFVADLGVVLAATGVQMVRVASAPTAGQYAVSNVGVYTFAAADASKDVLLSFEYSATSTVGQVFNITNEVMGTTPSFSMLLKQAFDGQTMVMKLNKCVSTKQNLPFKNDDFAVYDFEADAMADAAGNVGYICLY